MADIKTSGDQTPKSGDRATKSRSATPGSDHGRRMLKALEHTKQTSSPIFAKRRDSTK